MDPKRVDRRPFEQSITPVEPTVTSLGPEKARDMRHPKLPISRQQHMLFHHSPQTFLAFGPALPNRWPLLKS